METTLHVNDYKFSKPGKWRNKKIDFKIDSYETEGKLTAAESLSVCCF